MPPTIGITPDTHAHKGAWRYEITRHYAQCVERAGGLPVMLPYQPACIPDYLAVCDGFVLGGGDDPDTAPFGEAVHRKAKLVVPERQAFELALLAALDRAGHSVLGICLGMQWMALHAGGSLHQDLADVPGLPDGARQRHDHAEHDVVAAFDPPAEGEPTPLPPRCRVFSRHHQAVASPGRLRVVARSDEASGSLIEAIDRPGERFYLGVQWHPERTADATAGAGLFRQLVEAAAAFRAERV